MRYAKAMGSALRCTIAAMPAVLLLVGCPYGAEGAPLPPPGTLAAAMAEVSMTQDAAYVCGYSRHWKRRCWLSYGPFWPPTWRGSGWRGPGWYGAGWRKRYFY